MPASDSVAAKASLATTFSGRTVEESTTDPTPHASNWRSHPVAAPNAPPSAEVTRVSATAGLPPPVTAEAQLTRRVAPEYPDSAMRKGIEGYVDVHFTITPEGTVTNISVVDANPADIFSHAAMEAVRRWRYDPRVVDGQPVESQSQARLQFRLDSSLSH